MQRSAYRNRLRFLWFLAQQSPILPERDIRGSTMLRIYEEGENGNADISSESVRGGASCWQ